MKSCQQLGGMAGWVLKDFSQKETELFLSSIGDFFCAIDLATDTETTFRQAAVSEQKV